MEEKNKSKIEKWQSVKLDETYNLNIDKNYQYVPENFVFKILSNTLYYCIAYPILKIITKIIYDFKIEGKENLKDIKGGAISISNHVLILDCAMVGLALKKRKNYYTTQQESFEIPFVRKLIKLLRAIPIPKTIENKKQFVKEINKLLKQDKIVHFYPEGSLKPYNESIRNFKNGAFNFAIKNNVNIIPMVFVFREPQGIRKIFKRKKDVTLKILQPVKYENDEYEIQKLEYLKTKIKNEMEKAIRNDVNEENESEIYAI